MNSLIQYNLVKSHWVELPDDPTRPNPPNYIRLNFIYNWIRPIQTNSFLYGIGDGFRMGDPRPSLIIVSHSLTIGITLDTPKTLMAIVLLPLFSLLHLSLVVTFATSQPQHQTNKPKHSRNVSSSLYQP